MVWCVCIGHMMVSLFVYKVFLKVVWKKEEMV